MVAQDRLCHNPREHRVRYNMPVKPCQSNGKPGFKYGDEGKCYNYTPGNTKQKAEARLKAESQGIAIRQSGYKENES